MTVGEWRLALWESVKAEHPGTGPTFPMGPADIMKHGVAWGKTDAEIWQNPLLRASTLDEHLQCETLLAELRRQEQEVLEMERRQEQVGQRPRRLPNLEDRYREAIREVLRARESVTWAAVAERLDISESRLRERCAEARLPNPAAIAREIIARREIVDR